MPPWCCPFDLRGERDDRRLAIRLPDKLDTDRQTVIGPAQGQRDRRLSRDVEGIGERDVGEIIFGNPLRVGEERVERLRRQSDGA
jgi:hypothetical protein